MFLTAHRVVSPATGTEGINAFHYTHGDCTWEAAPPVEFLPEENPGELISQTVVVHPPAGNRVRSFVDIVGPGDLCRAELDDALAHILNSSVPARFPIEWPVQRVWIRFGVERALAPFWRKELHTLIDSAWATLNG